MKLILALVAMLLVIAGCASSPSSNYYSLNTPLVPADKMRNITRVMVGPVSVPSDMDRPQLVVQSGSSESKIYEYQRWAGSFKNQISRTIAANLAQDLSISNVWSFSESTQTQFDYQVIVDVQNIESRLGEGVVVDVLWTVKSASKTAKLGEKNAQPGIEGFMGRSLVRESVIGSGFDPLVAALGSAFAQVSKDIAKEMR
mgnify:CR=1 FL=1